MKNLSQRIKILFPNAKPLIDFVVVDDGNGNQKISEWRLSQPQPTQEQLDAVASQADLMDRQNAVKSTRANLYADPMDYLDAKVKQASSDPAIVAKGVEQEKAYTTWNLRVKSDNPIPTV